MSPGQEQFTLGTVFAARETEKAPLVSWRDSPMSLAMQLLANKSAASDIAALAHY